MFKVAYRLIINYLLFSVQERYRILHLVPFFDFEYRLIFWNIFVIMTNKPAGYWNPGIPSDGSARRMTDDDLKRNIRVFEEYAFKFLQEIIPLYNRGFKGYLINMETGAIETIYHDWFNQYVQQVNDHLDDKKRQLGLL
jgi:hypothetical protein